MQPFRGTLRVAAGRCSNKCKEWPNRHNNRINCSFIAKWNFSFTQNLISIVNFANNNIEAIAERAFKFLNELNKQSDEKQTWCHRFCLRYELPLVYFCICCSFEFSHENRFGANRWKVSKQRWLEFMIQHIWAISLRWLFEESLSGAFGLWVQKSVAFPPPILKLSRRLGADFASKRLAKR